MGYTTDFVGYVGIEPALNSSEIEYLTAFNTSRRFDRLEGPYAVPGNPRAEDHGDVPIGQYNAIAIGQPGLYCQWVPCWDGCCLTFDGREKFYRSVEWLRYLIDHFLRPQAVAAGAGDQAFADFTFDHELNGMIAGSRRDTRELFAIDVVSNEVVRRTLYPAGPRYADMAALAYEVEIDRQIADRRRRRTKVRGS